MPSIKISKELNTAMYFLTFTIKNWYYIFDRHNRWEILLDSLRYCQHQKDLKIFAWVFMMNHLHLIVSSPDVSGFVRDFKSFTSQALKKNISRTEPSILRIFQVMGGYQFWRKTNMPKIIEDEDYFFQKANYIEMNPVRKQYVEIPEHWIYSSANSKQLLKIERLET